MGKKLSKDTYICAVLDRSDMSVCTEHAGSKKDAIILISVLAERLADDLNIDIEEIVSAIRRLYYTDLYNSED